MAIREDTEEFQQLLQEVAARVDDYAQVKGYVISRARDRIVRELVRIYLQFGQFYCPCQDENNEDTICICREVREESYVELMGKCHCSLFLLPKG